MRLAMRLAVIFLLFAVVIEVCASFSCPDPCRRKWCVRHVEIGLRCVGNLVRDSCGCCYECAKQINESCGGLWNHGGTCDVGLMCQYSPSLPAIHPGICTRKVLCHVHGGANGQWIDVGKNFTIRECSNSQAAEFCVCQKDGTVDCKKSREC